MLTLKHESAKNVHSSYILSRAQNNAFPAFWSICAESVPCSSSGLYLIFWMRPGGIQRSTCEQRIEHVLKDFYMRNLSFSIERFQKCCFGPILPLFESARWKSSNFSYRSPLKRALSFIHTSTFGSPLGPNQKIKYKLELEHGTLLAHMLQKAENVSFWARDIM
jgi:hypothetical protein